MTWPPIGIPILDESALDAIREVQEAGAPDLVGETVGLFLSSVPERLAALERAVASRDSQGIRNNGHAIKGSSWLLGLMRLGKVCEVIEQGGAEGTLEHAPLWLDRVGEEYRLACDALRRVEGAVEP